MVSPGNVPAIVVVGRNDKTKRSDVIMQVAERLHNQGHAVYWFESPRAEASRQINASIARVWPRLAAAPSTLALPLRILRFTVKTALALLNRNRRDFLQAAIVSRPVMAARELGRFLDKLPCQAAFLITHSAGGIAATQTSSNAKVDRIICFGYPFQHPDRPPETYRTAHLSSVDKPLLIVQGKGDPYGHDPARFGVLLPADTRITMLDCDHDYSSLAAAEFGRVWAAVSEFAGLATRLA
ncbi:alpha/beta family hydrolase [Novosphingobium naphthalenivorans]|uniref:alpha/beta family hydrolase n=1 Tax=Novosphingobium naphthalenivorans TaxID=273168 RepID=UPI00082B2D95|nr:alpha/beta family hydrolase [Novosphingobium naphthalenivorans]